jgi:hypothetical protein
MEVNLINYNNPIMSGGLDMRGLPNISNDDFYKRINKIYKEFTIPKKKKTFKEFCFPKKYKLQLSQQFVSKFINPKSPYKGVLVYHRIGAGKTCTAVRICEEWKHLRNIICVMPASLRGGFRNELRTLCAENNYLKPNEREMLSKLHPSSDEYKAIIQKSDERIDEYYNIYSFNKFIDLAKQNKIKLNNTLLVIDEIQNMVSEEGSYYETLLNLINKGPKDLRIVLLSATPMFDKPHEIALTMNLLPIPEKLPVGCDFQKEFINIIKLRDDKFDFEVKNMDKFKEMIKGYVSFFKGAPDHVFPKMELKYIKCEMSDYQYRAYRNILRNESKNIKKKKITQNIMVDNLPNNFFIGTRYVSNIVFPNKKIGDKGLKSLTEQKIKRNIKKYSTKFNKILRKIKRNEKVFIYSSFKKGAGLKSLVKVLETFGYKNYITDGEGPNRYAVWSGDESLAVKEEIKAVYNNKNNLKGSKLKILLGSPSIKEGVSLTSVKQVHILEPNWNISKLQQIIGRASRFCSHKDVPANQRNVRVYIYLAYHRNLDESVDEYIRYLSEKKNKIIESFEKAIKEAAVDCKIFKNANVSKSQRIINCEV